MWLADTSVKRPVFATMVIMALVVLGIVSYLYKYINESCIAEF